MEGARKGVGAASGTGKSKSKPRGQRAVPGSDPAPRAQAGEWAGPRARAAGSGQRGTMRGRGGGQRWPLWPWSVWAFLEIAAASGRWAGPVGVWRWASLLLGVRGLSGAPGLGCSGVLWDAGPRPWAEVPAGPGPEQTRFISGSARDHADGLLGQPAHLTAEDAGSWPSWRPWPLRCERVAGSLGVGWGGVWEKIKSVFGLDRDFGGSLCKEMVKEVLRFGRTVGLPTPNRNNQTLRRPATLLPKAEQGRKSRVPSPGGAPRGPAAVVGRCRVHSLPMAGWGAGQVRWADLWANCGHRVQAPCPSSVPGRLLAAVRDRSWSVLLVALRPWPWGEPREGLYWRQRPWPDSLSSWDPLGGGGAPPLIPGTALTQHPCSPKSSGPDGLSWLPSRIALCCPQGQGRGLSSWPPDQGAGETRGQVQGVRSGHAHSQGSWGKIPAPALPCGPAPVGSCPAWGAPHSQCMPPSPCSAPGALVA